MSSQFGTKIRVLRKDKNLLLRHVAAQLEMDTAQLSKIECGKRYAKKEIVLKIASILKVEDNELFTLWLADQLYEVLKGEENALQAIKIVEGKLNK